MTGSLGNKFPVMTFTLRAQVALRQRLEIRREICISGKA